MQMLKGLGQLERAAIGGSIGSGVNFVIHFLARNGNIVNPTFDSQKAGISLAAEGTVAVLTGLFIDPWAGVISGVTALGLLGVDYAATRGLKPAPALPNAPAPGINTIITNAEKSLMDQGQALLKKIF